jgi:hypothetical protein
MLTVSKKMSMEVEDNGAKESSNFHCTKPHFLFSKLQKGFFLKLLQKGYSKI